MGLCAGAWWGPLSGHMEGMRFRHQSWEPRTAACETGGSGSLQLGLSGAIRDAPWGEQSLWERWAFALTGECMGMLGGKQGLPMSSQILPRPRLAGECGMLG